ncbi:hypothetical protein [Aureimonas sp. AU40]|uniref:hypothetical protein n=1 Tax=Aureimonas sp. AU40 TaxID=1637747 RepID=UPI000785DAA3|nr:hypothetical protein [Aureimonas sp. AU40]
MGASPTLWAQMTDTVLRRLLLLAAVLIGPAVFIQGEIMIANNPDPVGFTTHNLPLIRVLAPIPAMLVILATWATLERRGFIRGRWKDWFFTAALVSTAYLRVREHVFPYDAWDEALFQVLRTFEKVMSSHMGLWLFLLVVLATWRWVFGKRETAKAGNPEI